MVDDSFGEQVEVMEEGSRSPWDVLKEAGRSGRLHGLLTKLSRASWTLETEHGENLLHMACRGSSVSAAVALLQSGLLDVSAKNFWGAAPLHYAIYSEEPRMMEVLCAAGADLRSHAMNQYAPIDCVIEGNYWRSYSLLRVLVANGVRLATVSEVFRHRIPLSLVEFERGVLRCRAAVVAVLRQNTRFSRDVAIAIWATRYDKKWQN